MFRTLIMLKIQALVTAINSELVTLHAHHAHIVYHLSLNEAVVTTHNFIIIVSTR